MKICCMCKEDLPLDEFGRDKTRKDGLAPRCKLCERERQNMKRLEKQGKSVVLIQPYGIAPEVARWFARPAWQCAES